MSMKTTDGELFKSFVFESRPEQSPVNVKIVGIGGAGGRLVSALWEMKMPGAEYIALDTDINALELCPCPCKVLLGENDGIYERRGAEFGRLMAEKSIAAIQAVLSGAHIVILLAGLGGSTGTGAAPIVANAAVEAGALTVCMVTRPFPFEGEKNIENADRGIADLLNTADSVLVFQNKQPTPAGESKPGLAEIFKQADDLFYQRINRIMGFINHSGYVNIDFRDFYSVIKKAGLARLSFAAADGAGDMRRAAEEIMGNADLIASMKGSENILVNFEAPPHISVELLERVHLFFRTAAPANADFLWGIRLCEDYTSEISITILAAGLNA